MGGGVYYSIYKPLGLDKIALDVLSSKKLTGVKNKLNDRYSFGEG
jgi:hypothetical protein